MKFKVEAGQMELRTNTMSGDSGTASICKKLHKAYPEAAFGIADKPRVKEFQSEQWEPITPSLFEMKSLKEFQEKVASRFDLHLDEAMGYWMHRDNVIMAMPSDFYDKLLQHRNDLFEEQYKRRAVEPPDPNVIKKDITERKKLSAFDAEDFRPEVP